MDHKNTVETIQKEGKNLFKDLFKFEKSFFLDFLFYIHIVTQIIVAFGYLGSAFMSMDLFKILGMVVLYPLVFFAIRFMFEFYSVLFTINKNLVDIKNKK